MSVSPEAVASLDLAPRSRRRRRPSPLIVASFLVVAVVVVCAVFGSHIAPHDPGDQDLPTGLSGPSSEHWLGTDDLGRDVFSRVIVGARTAVVGPVVIALGAMLIGNALGVFAGFHGGSLDSLVLRWVDFMYALPALLLAIVVVGTLGGGYWLAVVLLLVLTAPYDTRLIRGATLEQRPRPYVEAATILGLYTAPRHVLAHLAERHADRAGQHVPELRLRPRGPVVAVLRRASASAPGRPTGVACSPRTAP